MIPLLLNNVSSWETKSNQYETFSFPFPFCFSFFVFGVLFLFVEGIFIQTLTCHGSMNDISCSSIKLQGLNQISLPLMKNMMNTDLLCLVLVGTFHNIYLVKWRTVYHLGSKNEAGATYSIFLTWNNLNNIFLQLFSQLSPLSLITSERSFNDCVILYIN